MPEQPYTPDDVALVVAALDTDVWSKAGQRSAARDVLDALAAAGRLRDAPKPLHRLPPKERRALRQAEADDRLKVDDPDREKLAGALHDIDCGWNCQGHGIVQSANDRRYRRLADVALRTLADRLLPGGASREEEWTMRYRVNGVQQLGEDGGVVLDSLQECQDQIAAWREWHAGKVTYTDVEYLRRDVHTGPWAAAPGHLSEMCREGACEGGYIACRGEPGDPPCTHACHAPVSINEESTVREVDHG